MQSVTLQIQKEKLSLAISGQDPTTINEKISLRQIRSLGIHYLPCSKCKGHPGYPEIPAITMHRNGRCVVCNFQEKKRY